MYGLLPCHVVHNHVFMPVVQTCKQIKPQHIQTIDKRSRYLSSMHWACRWVFSKRARVVWSHGASVCQRIQGIRQRWGSLLLGAKILMMLIMSMMMLWWRYRFIWYCCCVAVLTQTHSSLRTKTLIYEHMFMWHNVGLNLCKSVKLLSISMNLCNIDTCSMC